MDFFLLQPLEVEREGESVALGSGKERALLVLLLLHANEVVSRDTLIDGLWQAPPPTAVHTLETHVSRLRKVLERDGARILTRPGGYLIEVDPERIDLCRFERLREEARQALAAGDAVTAAERLRGALSLWHGEPLADLTTEPFVDAEAARLAELRVNAFEETFEVELALGRHRVLLDDLEGLVAEHPERERLTAQLMLALYRSGRQAEALAAYRVARRRLNDEVGIEPGKELRSLQRAILQQAPELDLPSPAGAAALPVESEAADPKPSAAATVGAAAPPAARLSRRAGWVAIAALVVTAVTVAGLRFRGGGISPPVRLAGNGIGILDPASGRLVRGTPLAFSPEGVAIGGADIWTIGPSEGTLVRIGPKTGAVVQTVHAGDIVGAFAIGAGAAWVTRPLDATLARIDLETGGIVQLVPVGKGAAGVAFGFGSVWVALPEQRSVARIDPDTGRVEATIETQIAGRALAVGEGAVWVAGELEQIVVEIDPSRNEPIRPINLGAGPSAVAAGEGALWVANNDADTVSKIDPRTGVIRSTVTVDAAPTALAVAPGAVWVASEGADTLTRINPWTGRVSRTFPLPGRPTAVTESDGVVAVSLAVARSAHRGGVLRVGALSGWIDTVDPARATSAGAWTILSTVGDGLVGFRRRADPNGSRVAADLAERLPSSTAGATRYMFQLRSGVRFSNGAPVRPADVRFTIERLFRMRSPGRTLYTDIVGGTRCARTPEECDLSEGILVDDAHRTVTFRLAAPDPDFLNKLALPFAYVVPSGSPLPRATAPTEAPPRPLPGTGPYMIAAYEPDQRLTLVRNPWFEPSSSASRPGGYPDKITVTIRSPTAAQAAALVESADRGRTDVAALPADAPAATRHQRRHPGRTHPWHATFPDVHGVQTLLHLPSELVVVSERVHDYQESPVFGPLLDQVWVH